MDAPARCRISNHSARTSGPNSRRCARTSPGLALCLRASASFTCCTRRGSAPTNRVPAGSSEGGRWTSEGGGSLVHRISRRPRSAPGTPAQEARLAVATARAREAVRRLRELDPEWKEPHSFTSSIEGEIRHQETTAEAAERRLAEILQDAIPGTNPSWGVNRLRKELNEQGYLFEKSTRGPGYLYRNDDTNEAVRIMERPQRRFRNDSPQKHLNDYYYRYKPPGGAWGDPITIPNK